MRQLIFLFVLVIGFQVQAQEENFIETNGVKLYYETHGEGEALLLLHGNTMTHDMWTPWLAELSKNFKVITVDWRGHGQSTNPTKEFTHRLVAKDLYGMLDKLKIDTFSAMGFSSGGMVLLHMATMDTTRIRSLILIGATPYFTKTSREQSKKLTYEYVSENNPGWMEYMKSAHPGGKDQIVSVLNNYIVGADAHDDMNFTPPHLSTINSQTLIIHGDSDPFFSVDLPFVLHNSIPNSNLWIVPNLAHSTPQYGTDLGNLFISTITEFMTGNWDE